MICERRLGKRCVRKTLRSKRHRSICLWAIERRKTMRTQRTQWRGGRRRRRTTTTSLVTNSSRGVLLTWTTSTMVVRRWHEMSEHRCLSPCFDRRCYDDWFGSVWCSWFGTVVSFVCFYQKGTKKWTPRLAPWLERPRLFWWPVSGVPILADARTLHAVLSPLRVLDPPPKNPIPLPISMRC